MIEHGFLRSIPDTFYWLLDTFYWPGGHRIGCASDVLLEGGTLWATNPLYERKLAISCVESTDPAIGGSCNAGDRKKDSYHQVNGV